MRSMLISIKPEFVDKILTGEKTIELRRRFTRRWDEVDKLFIYSTSPVKSVVAETKITDVKQLSVNHILRNHRSSICIDEERMRSYFEGLDFGYAIFLSNVRRLESPIELKNLASLGLQRPPQSYSYLDNVEIETASIASSDRYERLHSGRRRRCAA